MAYSAIIQSLDRLTVRSIMRGSTATVAGVVGTLAVIVLCLAIFIPPTASILRGEYFETEFYTDSTSEQSFYSNEDFKIAVVFRNKVDNSVANHSAILEYSYSVAYEIYPDYSEVYSQPMSTCAENPSYFDDISNAEAPPDCFLFPEYALFDMFMSYGSTTTLYYEIWAMTDPDPFASANNQLSGYEYRLSKLFEDYYYEVYFTSKIIKADGSSELTLHRFYSTEAEPSSFVGTSWNQVIYNVRNTSMDLSIMPWRNSKNTSNLVWLGQLYNYQLLLLEDAAQTGTYVAFSEYMYQIRAFRYYKKVDFLAGVIGGAMLLFYLLLWLPCNYINLTLHQIRNTENLLLTHSAKEEDPILEDDLHPARVPWVYWLSNPVLNFFWPSLKQSAELVAEGERELDVVTLLKKLKIVERTLKKKNLYREFQSKVLRMRTDAASTVERRSHIGDASSVIGESELNSVVDYNEPLVGEEDFKEEDVDDKFRLTAEQLTYVTSPPSKHVFNSITALAIRNDRSSFDMKQQENRNKWSALYDEKKKPSRARVAFNFLCDLIEKFDFFGARPNLNAGASGSSFVGFCGVLLIILLTCLTVGLTVKNANVPQIMILEEIQPEDNFGASLTPGVDLKFAVCSDYLSYLEGANRYALFRFFYESAAGRQYLTPSKLTSNDYALFDLTAATSPVNINYCYKMTAPSPIFLGKSSTNYGYFGFRLEPFCASTPGFCSTTATSSNTNFINFMNNALVYLFLPENRFDPEGRKFVNNLVFQGLNINRFYMNNASAMEETLFVDNVRIEDDTRNFFMRKAPNVTFRGIATNANTPYPISKMFNNSALYYEARIWPSTLAINYFITTPKADTILGIIGGVIVLWYAICHWLGKVYNNFQVRATHADVIYSEDSIDENLFKKLLAVSPVPLCLIPTCFNMRSSVARMRQVDKKVLNNLHYLWLVKYVDNVFQLSASLFPLIAAQNLSKVYIKEKIDESLPVVPVVEEQPRPTNDDDFIDAEKLNISANNSVNDSFGDQKELETRNSKNKVLNESYEGSKEILIDEKEEKEKFFKLDEKVERFSENYINGHPKPLKFGWMDSFEYQASLTFKGKREVTSCCGGFCCLVLLMFILIVVNFELGVYFSRSDTKIGMTTSIMQPLQSESTSTYNSNITVTTGSDFKLAVTFSTEAEDIPHNVSSYLDNGLRISVFQKELTKIKGVITTKTTEYPMVPCPNKYLSGSLSPLVDPSYYKGEQFGYCIADGVTLRIAGLPEDITHQTFTLSIHNGLSTPAGKTNIQKFLHNYFPKFHFTSPSPDFQTKKLAYQISSFVFDPYNISQPIQQNLSLSKMMITYDDEIGYTDTPLTVSTYRVNPFQQLEVAYYGLPSESLSYNLTFDNTFLVEHYTIRGDKFYETFGIVGGLIAFFIFGFGCLPRAFNNYRMRYLIGRELYLFEVAKKKQAKNAARGRLRKSTEQAREMADVNNFSEGSILRAYLLSFVGSIWQNYNLDPVLRRVTLIQQRVEKDLSVSEVYKKLHTYRDVLNEHYSGSEAKPADIYMKHIYNEQPEEAFLEGMEKLKGYAKKYSWTAYEQFSIGEAYRAKINLREVFDAAFLQEAFNFNVDLSVGNISNISQTQLSANTDSINQSDVMSRAED